MLPTTKIARSIINKNIKAIGAIHHGVWYNKAKNPNERNLSFHDVSLDDDKLAELVVEECNQELVKLGYEPTVRFTYNPRWEQNYNEEEGMSRNQFAIKARAVKA